MAPLPCCFSIWARAISSAALRPASSRTPGLRGVPLVRLRSLVATLLPPLSDRFVTALTLRRGYDRNAIEHTFDPGGFLELTYTPVVPTLSF